jgi:hypothetical protein
MSVTVPAYPLVPHAGRHRIMTALAADCVVHGLLAQGWTSAGHLVVALVIVVLVPFWWHKRG